MGIQPSIHIDLPYLKDAYPVGAEAGMMEDIQTMVSNITTSMPPPRNSSIVPF